MSEMDESHKPHKCEYCKKSFVRESTLYKHVCEQKRRAMQKDDKPVRLGFYAFQRFYTLCANNKSEKTYEEFSRSQYYNSFVKFGSFLNNVKPLYMEKYIDYVVKSGVKLDQWCREEMYEKYVLEYILNENVETALERSIKTMENWAEQNSSVWNHYFVYAKTNTVTWHIRDGKISPWVVLNSENGKKMLSQFSDEQLQMVYRMLDPGHWNRVFEKNPDDVKLARGVIEKGKI